MRCDRHIHRCLWRIDGRKLKHGDELSLAVLIATSRMAPLGLGMACEVKRFHDAIPGHFTTEKVQ